ncbi:MAG: DUF3916 domain-containing protein [Pseudomonadota bacterium]|nr:DUF3916 domain-containing protein [Pseudomonadota bacterium]
MRQFALSSKKLRNIPRRKRALARWAAGFNGRYIPAQQPDECFFNWKIPVHLHLLQGKQTTPDLQAFCMQQLIQAAQHLIAAAQPSEQYYRVACLIVWPYLHQSEVTIFYDPEYYQGFLNTPTPLPRSLLLEQLALDIPEDWQVVGVDVTQPDDPQSVIWWVIGQPVISANHLPNPLANHAVCPNP